MESSERTHDVYEQIEAYKKPPLVPLPDLDDDQVYEIAGIKMTPFSRALTRFMLSAIRIRQAYPQLAQNLEQTLRTTNLRLPGLYSPLISASIMLADDPRGLDPCQRAATLLVGARSLCDDLYAGKLPADTYRDQPLEMGQYPNLFSTCLIIENARTRLYKSKQWDKVIVALNGRFYQLSVGHPGKETGVNQLIRLFQELTDRHGNDRLAEGEPAPGLLTCAQNRTQFQAFGQMALQPVNQHSLQMLRDNFLTICLDLDHHPASDAEAVELSHMGNNANRWFHSSLQLVIFGNGKATMIGSFTCYIDGNTMMRGAAEIQKRAAACPLMGGSGETLPALDEPKRLEWKIDPELVKQAEKDLQFVADNQPSVFEIPGIGREFFKAHDLSPVPVFMIALEMASRRFLPRIPSITQFLVMSRYRCMDMTAANITTPEVMSCAETLSGDNPAPGQAIEQIKTAVASQENVARQARSSLNLIILLNLYIHSLSGARKKFSGYLYALVTMALSIFGFTKSMQREILVSHPEIYPQVPLIGRPGIRLLYVRYFGLHYQIHEDKISIIVMPGKNWPVSNQDLVDAIADSLKKIRALVEAA